MSAARRKRIDRIVAAVIAVVVVAVGVVIYLTSDIRATASVLGAATESPAVAEAVPTELSGLDAADGSRPGRGRLPLRGRHHHGCDNGHRARRNDR